MSPNHLPLNADCGIELLGSSSYLSEKNCKPVGVAVGGGKSQGNGQVRDAAFHEVRTSKALLKR